jgi:hypothetical protein
MHQSGLMKQHDKSVKPKMYLRLSELYRKCDKIKLPE